MEQRTTSTQAGGLHRLLMLVLVIPLLALIGCEDDHPGSACLDPGNPWCSPPASSGGTGANTSSSSGGTGGSTNVPCGALPEYVCDGECINLLSDPDNCGACGRVCGNGQTCVDAHCAWADPPDECTSSTEICDNVDNDCDAVIDEDFNLFSDDAHCGMCGHACAAGQHCANGACAWDSPQNNCVPTGAESCNGIDDDCDQSIDETFNLLTDTANCGMCGNMCGGGQSCVNGHCQWDTPQSSCVPSTESCNNVDDDCDLDIDETFNLQSDATNCGTCGIACELNQSCLSGHCAWNTPVDNCTPVPESCNNEDDDCDLGVDEDFNLLSDATNCGTCGHACAAGQFCNSGHCAWITPLDNCNPDAEICDNKDNDCDDGIDEDFNLNSDNLNCGTCQRICDVNQTCFNGKCRWDTPIDTCVPSPEECNNKDDDCDNDIDEGYNLLSDALNCGTCGKICATGQSCLNGHCLWDTPVNQCVPVPEECNNADDDCDQYVDEDFNLNSDDLNCGVCGKTCDVGQSCFNGKCRWDNPINNCISSPEVCNNKDDDCDNDVDEDFNLLTDNLNCGACGHACGINQHCNNGHCALDTPVTCTPSPETCDNQDNDCDLDIDEDFNLLTDVLNCGTCGNACGANQHCSNGHCTWDTPVACTPGPEVCDNSDNDCDLGIDEDFNLLSDPTNCGACGNACAPGQSCLSGHCSWNTPVQSCTPSPEVCDNQDNDCDLGVDENFNLLNDVLNCGMCGNACAPGQSCLAGHCTWDTPVQSCTPSPEVCDNQDNDCDLGVDENFNLLNDVLNCGACGNACAGGQHCESGHCQWDTPIVNCVPAAEVCDQTDNDCDNAVDENFNLLVDDLNCGFCGNACAGGQHCANGHCTWNTPVVNCTPSPEVCDQSDNDCDDGIDEDFNLLSDDANCGTCGNACAPGQSCMGGHCTWDIPINGCTPGPEVCDQIDNDCDNGIDENFNLLIDPLNCGACGNNCAPNQHCESGHCEWDIPVSCSPAAEVCDNIDNDCDGSIDEPYNLLLDVNNCGTCGHSCGLNQVCSGGHCQWITPIQSCVPAPESCNNSDDDCDNAIDEDFNLLNDDFNCGICGNVCAGGQHCGNGHCTWDVPVNQCVPAPEVCDNGDNDCDDQIDEDFNLLIDNGHCGTCGHSCPAGQICQNGYCAYAVPQSLCGPPTSEVCDNMDNDCDDWIDEDYNLLADPANCGACGHSCAGGQVCQGGHCAWITPIGSCVPAGESCNNIDDDCDSFIDEDFNLLSNSNHCGACNHACAGGQYCQNGHCAWIVPQSSCVPVAETCNNVDDDCDSLIDENWNFLTDKNHCGNCTTVCPGTQICSNGHCQAVP